MSTEEFKVKRRGPRGERLLLKKQKENQGYQQNYHQGQPRMSFKDMEFELNNLRKRENTPKVDLLDLGDKFLVTIELPGVLKDDIKIELMDDQFILVSGSKKPLSEIKNDQIIYTECKYGNFTRRVKLKSIVKSETIQVTFDNSILQITLEKLPEIKQNKYQIKIDKRLDEENENDLCENKKLEKIDEEEKIDKNVNENLDKEIKEINFNDLEHGNWSDEF